MADSLEDDPPTLTLIDEDENPLRVWLRSERIQLAVIDCRPELAAGELRRFSSALFAAYVAPALASRLADAREQLAAAMTASHETAAALTAVADALAAATALLPPGPQVTGEPEPGPRARVRYAPVGERRGAPGRGSRAREPGVCWRVASARVSPGR